MAFPIPSHLPRKKDVQDVSTKILTVISETDTKSLNAGLATSWVGELNDTVAQTKSKIHERISNDLPSFNEQFSIAKSIQERLQSLTCNVDKLHDGLSNPESGLIPTLMGALTRHAKLSQESLDAEVRHATLSHLLRCKQDFQTLGMLVQEGRLPDAMRACTSLENVLAVSPDPLNHSVILNDLKRSFQAMKARTEEQLSDAYTRSLEISPSVMIIRPSVQVRQSDTILPLSQVLSSLSTAALASPLASLRRDITSHYIDFLLKQPAAVNVDSPSSISGTSEPKLALFLSPPDRSDLPSRLENLSTVMVFLNTHLFPHLPPTERTAFPLSLCKPLRNALLNQLLIPLLPSSLDVLPKFLGLVDQACRFEAEYLEAMLGDHSGEHEIKAWASNVGLHYERKRRMELSDAARLIIMNAEDESRAFFVDLQISLEHENNPRGLAQRSRPELIEEEAEAAWGFDGEEQDQDDTTTDVNGWGFDDNLDADPQLPTHHAASEPITVDEEDPADAWGWNDDDVGETPNVGGPVDDVPWNDGWNDESVEDKPQRSKSASVPKPAKRLERLSSRGKGAESGLASPPIRSPVPIPPPPPTPLIPAASENTVAPKWGPIVVKETCMVSGRAKDLICHLQSILDEGTKLASSRILPTSSNSSSPTGFVLLQAAPFSLDLFRAIYPVAFCSALKESPKRSMRFSNDCLYLSSEVERILPTVRKLVSSIKEKLEDCKDRLKLLGDRWYEETIEQQCQSINKLLDGAAGFVDTTDQDRFDECENAVAQVLQQIRRLAQQWKTVLNKSKFYVAIGSVLDASLSRILADILALRDITEVESHRLSELCRVLNASEGLFVEEPAQPSFVVSYVPSWLKFSYLSELLEASIADISYLFEEGVLVDFEIEELVKLVQALFADTPLRTNTIHKLLRGHPASS